MKRILIALLIVVGFVKADRESSPFEGTHQVTRTNMATGESFSEELRVSWFGGYYLFENIQGGGGGELVEQEGVELGEWVASGSVDYGGTVGLYRMDGQGITGMELYVPDTTFYIIKSEGADPLELKEQWARGRYRHLEFSDDSTSVESSMELTGDSKLWVMTWYPWWADSRSFTGYGLSSGNAVAMMFHYDETTVLRLYTITGGNLEGRWFHTWWDEKKESFEHATGSEELWVQKLYE